MAYEITATRRRPTSFDALAGQEFVSTTLKAAIGAGRIAHAFLFSGPRGCGKTSTARILAKSLNCETGPAAVPCGTCDSCVSISRGSSLDVIEIDGASNTSVENIRQIRDEVLFPPNSARYKIYIIDEVHMLSGSAFNALLKTIEEPPPYVVFMFATTEIHKVPATIKSRCQQFNFRLIPVEVIKSQLEEAAAETGVAADDEALLWIAKEATGSMRDAYTLFDQVVSFSGGRVTAELIREKLGLVGLERLNDLFDSCAAGNVKDALEKIDAILGSGVAIEQLVIDVAEYLRSLLLIKHGIERESLLGAPARAYSPAALEAFDTDRVERALGIVFDLHRDLRFSVDPRFELELAFARVAALVSTWTRGEVAEAIDRIRSALTDTSPKGRFPRRKDESEALADAVPAAGGAGSGDDEGSSAGSRGNPGAGSGARSTRAGAAAAPDDDPGPERKPRESPFRSDDEVASADVPARGGNEGLLDPEALRVAVTRAFAKDLPALSSSLAKASSWRIEGSSLAIEFENGMELEYVRRETGRLAAKVAELCGTSLAISFSRAAKPRDPGRAASRDAAASAETEQDDPVAAVSRVFRGTVVGEDAEDGDEPE